MHLERIMRLLTVLAAVGLTLPSSASVILTSFPTSANGALSLNGNPTLNVAAGFTMGGTAFDLSGAVVQLGAIGVATFPTSVVHADLFGGSSTAPSGASLVSFTIPAGTISGSAVNLTLSPSAAFTLQASNTYWLVLHPDSSVVGNLGWNFATNAAAGAFATYAGGTQATALPPTVPISSGNLVFEIDGNARVAGTPEPGSLVLLSLGVAGVVLRRPRSRRPPGCA